MIFNWSSNQQYFGSLIITWDSSFAEMVFLPGEFLPKHIFMTERKLAFFDSDKKVMRFFSKDKNERII